MALTSPATVGGGVARDITVGITRKSSNIRSKVIETVLVLCLLLSMVILLVLIVDLIWRSWSVWTERPVDFLTSGLNSQNAAEAGVWQGIKGTLILMVLVALVAFPLGIACAVYLEEYSSRSRFAKWTRINVRNLAGVPSIVYGLLGLAIFVKALSSSPAARRSSPPG